MGRRSLITEFNRRAAAIVVICLTALVVHRVLGARAGEPVSSVLRGDALILASVFFTAGATQQAVLALAGLPLVVVAALIPTGIAAGEAIFGAAIGLAALIATVGSAWASKRTGPGRR